MVAHISFVTRFPIEDIDGGVRNRVRCIPYESTFVERQDGVDHEHYVYLIDPSIEMHIPKWKHAFMLMLLESASANDPMTEPKEVTEHTDKLIDRDNITKQFIEDRITEAEDKKTILTSKVVYAEYVYFCKENSITDMVKRHDLENEISQYLKTPIIMKSNIHRRIWRGYSIKMECDVDLVDSE